MANNSDRKLSQLTFLALPQVCSLASCEDLFFTYIYSPSARNITDSISLRLNQSGAQRRPRETYKQSFVGIRCSQHIVNDVYFDTGSV